MTIAKNLHNEIIQSLDIGNSVAEFDHLLEAARIETPVFLDILLDKYDIIPGRKGAGKTAIFKIIKIMSDHLLREKNLVVLAGVESEGDPIFLTFRKVFHKFSEFEFENFWKMYFVLLIYNQFIKNQKFSSGLSGSEAEIKNFKSKCYEAGIPETQSVMNMKDIINLVLHALPKIKRVENSAMVDVEKPNLFTATINIEFQKSENQSRTAKESVYVNDIGIALRKILEKSGFKIWIILDRLDEVFERFSQEEFNGLRGLLKAYKSFNLNQDSDIFRIKIFLRDDIKRFLTEEKTYNKFFKRKKLVPLTAATHIFAKESPTLSWSQDEIQQLILRRFLLSTNIRSYLGIQTKNRDQTPENIIVYIKELLRSKTKRDEYWEKIFPQKISSTSSLNWMYGRLMDANGVVTPRSVIDFCNAAIMEMRKINELNFEDKDKIFTLDSLKVGLDTASKSKLEKDILNEFPSEQENIYKLTEGKPKLSKKDLEKLYGSQWKDIAESLQRMGILKYVKNSQEYRVVNLFRPALNITYKY